MPFSVEMEILSATYDGDATVTVSLAYRLINEANQNVAASKTVPLTIRESTGAFDAKDILRQKYDEAVAWGYFLLASQKLTPLVGQKTRTVIA